MYFKFSLVNSRETELESLIAHLRVSCHKEVSIYIDMKNFPSLETHDLALTTNESIYKLDTGFEFDRTQDHLIFNQYALCKDRCKSEQSNSLPHVLTTFKPIEDKTRVLDQLKSKR